MGKNKETPSFEMLERFSNSPKYHRPALQSRGPGFVKRTICGQSDEIYKQMLHKSESPDRNQMTP
jgi:hypothetical protein